MRLLITVACLFLSVMACSQKMDIKNLKLTIAQKAVIINENNNIIEYELDGIRIYLITDELNNRMRMMSGIVEIDKLQENDLQTLLEANYDRALDAKYAISNNVLWSVYAHPLKELEKEQILDALIQVKNLVVNYGTTYNSTDMIYGQEDDN